MKEKELSLYLLFIMISVLALVPGCSEKSSVDPHPGSLIEAKTAALSVDDYSLHHNTQVQRLVANEGHSDSPKTDLIEKFSSLVEKMDADHPEMAGNPSQVANSREILPTLVHLDGRGHPPLEVFSLLQRSRSEFESRHEVHPEISEGLDSATGLLIKRDFSGLSQHLQNLKILTDRIGSEDQKCVVGVLQGSFMRAQQAKSDPWYWPWVIIYDFIGSMIGGSNISALFSGWAEMALRDIPFPGSF